MPLLASPPAPCSVRASGVFSLALVSRGDVQEAVALGAEPQRPEAGGHPRARRRRGGPGKQSPLIRQAPDLLTLSWRLVGRSLAGRSLAGTKKAEGGGSRRPSGELQEASPADHGSTSGLPALAFALAPPHTAIAPHPAGSARRPGAWEAARSAPTPVEGARLGGGAAGGAAGPLPTLSTS